MSRLGMGVMLQSLGGNKETVETIKESLGKQIKSIEIIEDGLNIQFDDKTGVRLFDDGQSCCEHRYMNSDDDLTYYKDSKLMDFELSDVIEEEKGDDVKESQFLKVKTNKGDFTIANYNEHNGYYGGFHIVARKLYK